MSKPTQQAMKWNHYTGTQGGAFSIVGTYRFSAEFPRQFLYIQQFLFDNPDCVDLCVTGENGDNHVFKRIMGE